MMDNANVKNRPKGPKDRRPPKKKAQAERNPTSPLDENPPLVNVKPIAFHEKTGTFFLGRSTRN